MENRKHLFWVSFRVEYRVKTGVHNKATLNCHHKFIYFHQLFIITVTIYWGMDGAVCYVQWLKSEQQITGRGRWFRGTKMQWLKQTVFVVNWERRRKDEVTGSRLGRFHCSCRIRSWLRCRREDSKWYILLTLRAVLFWPCFIYFIDGVCVSLFFSR